MKHLQSKTHVNHGTQAEPWPMTAPYRCWAAWPEVPRSSPISAREIPAASGSGRVEDLTFAQGACQDGTSKEVLLATPALASPSPRQCSRVVLGRRGLRMPTQRLYKNRDTATCAWHRNGSSPSDRANNRRPRFAPVPPPGTLRGFGSVLLSTRKVRLIHGEPTEPSVRRTRRVSPILASAGYDMFRPEVAVESQVHDLAHHLGFGLVRAVMES